MFSFSLRNSMFHLYEFLFDYKREGKEEMVAHFWPLLTWLDKYQALSTNEKLQNRKVSHRYTMRHGNGRPGIFQWLPVGKIVYCLLINTKNEVNFVFQTFDLRRLIHGFK